VDTETRRIIEEAVEEARGYLERYRPELDHLADLLCEQETVDGSQIDAILTKIEIRDPVAVETVRAKV
jgi:ATP-dependent Zn protease